MSEQLAIYGPNRELLAELDEDGNTLVEYVYMDGEPAVQYRIARELPETNR